MNIDDYVICTAKVLLTIWYLSQAVIVIITERAKLFMVTDEIKVTTMVSGIHYWYQLVSG
jgi:hypothetical protein